MKSMNRLFALLLLFSTVLLNQSCKKYLDAKSDKALVVPSSLQDLQAIIDYYSRVNDYDAGAGVLSADDYYLTTTDYNSLRDETYRNIYTWNKDHLFQTGINDWSYTYDNIYRANLVLDNMSAMTRTTANATDWDNLKGQALFLRAKSFLKTAFIWSVTYDSATANTDLGIPLRLNSDFNILSVRSSVQQTYNKIIQDLKEAIPLLPNTPLHVERSSKSSVYALLARTYLSMGEYDSCLKYADACLQITNILLDYNTLTASATYPIKKFNVEVMMNNQLNPVFSPIKKVDSALYSFYNTNDLRKIVLFKSNGDGTYSFKGSYLGSSALFGGIATDEVYLMRAECYARIGNITLAMNDLNTLLMKRWKAGTFVSLTATTPKDALALILKERRKELILRDTRWMDIKRLNKEGANIILTRAVNGVTYTLPPNDLRYALAIPEDVIALSGMQQNLR